MKKHEDIISNAVIEVTKNTPNEMLPSVKKPTQHKPYIPEEWYAR